MFESRKGKHVKNIQNQIFWITLLFFVLGLLHITFALVGLMCFIIPFVQYYQYKDKVWCKYYCPRAGFFNRIISRINLGLRSPKFLAKVSVKKAVVGYLALNLFFVTMSTTMVALGRIPPIEMVRFLIVFPLPLELPQLFNFAAPAPLVHLGYRVFSMMFTSVVVGSVLGILYRPRTWCTVCPINTLTKVRGEDGM